MSEGLAALLRSRFPRDLSTPFLEDDRGRIWRYADLDAASARYAHLLAELGVRPGDRVAVQVEKSPQAVFLYLAVLRAGAVFLPLNPAYTAAEVGYFVGDAEPGVAVCRPDLESRYRELGVSTVLTLGSEGDGTLAERSAAAPDEFADVPVGGGHLAAILYTSGTTGRAKGAMLTQQNLRSNGETLRELWGFTDGDVLLHALPIFHAHGLFVALHTTLLAGAWMIFLARFDPERVIAALPRATVLMGVPTFYTRLLAREDFGAAQCSNLRLFISGSAPLSAETHQQFRLRTGHAILERYGMTETGMNTSNPLHGERVPGSVGPALPGVEIRVTDDTGGVLPVGAIGNVEVRGPNVCAGYWRMPDKTRESFRDDGFFVTGDVGVIDGRGYLTLVGRAKDLIISGGLNVYPAEVESVIDRVAGVVESAVVGVAHADFGEAVVAVVKRRADGAVAERDVIHAARRELAAYKVPKRVFFVDELPRNAMGKVEKARLRDRYRETFSSPSR
jgi:malonyl-CoA/methylmalonyl-CoA synthetase